LRSKVSALEKSNEVIRAIRTRRNAAKLSAERPVGRELIEAVLEAAIWAPNHHLTEPWRFVVITGGARKRLGDAVADAILSMPATPPPSQEMVSRERMRPLTAPVVIAVICCPDQEKRAIPQEELVAGGGALQNMLLAAHSFGLGTKLKTGAYSYSQVIRSFLNMKDSESLIAFVYLGLPEGDATPGRRMGLEGKVDWRS
jgi:nitroreductase